MSSYVLSPHAQEDIDEIWDYTAERWDAEQAERYSRELQNGRLRLLRAIRRGSDAVITFVPVTASILPALT